jgi:hypothetical protein
MQTGTSTLVRVQGIDSRTREIKFDYPNVASSTVQSRVRPMGVTEVSFTDQHGNPVHEQGDFHFFTLTS